MADRLVIMNAGHVEQAGRPADVYSNPASAFVAAFFGQVNEVASEVRDRQAMTPFGAVPAPGLGEGARVRVLIRPEALRLRPAEDDTACPAKVLAARLLGRSSWIHLCLGTQPGPAAPSDNAHLHFHARVPGRFLPQEGMVLGVDLDASQAFVFAADASI